MNKLAPKVTNPEIRDFTNKFLQSARDRISDIDKKADYKKLERQGYADEANLYRLTSQEEGVDYRRSDIKAMRRALDASGSAMISAIRKTESLKTLNDDAEHLRHLLREVNELFVQVMEGKTAQGQESFSEALISIFRHTFMSYETRRIMEFVISYFYGDNTHFKRSIPYILAKGADLYPKECALFESEQKKGDLKVIYEPLPPKLLKLTEYECLRLMVVIRAFKDLPTQDSIRRLVRICELLGDPQNHILVKSGQLIKKQIYTRTVSDMKAEMVQELASLSRYTAWVKKVDDSNMVVKNKIRTFSVAERFEYNMDYMEILQRIIKQTHELYCTHRDLIEEEIIKRQAKWRGTVQSPSAEETAGDKKGADSSDKSPPPNSLTSEQVPQEKEKNGAGKPKPPPSSISSQPLATIQEPEEKNLIYRSNFYLPDPTWLEMEVNSCRTKYFRQDGYYHIRVHKFGYAYQELKFILADFRFYFDAEFVTSTHEADHYGINFRCGGAYKDHYNLSISRSGCYSLQVYTNRTEKIIISSRFSNLIRRGNCSNSVMVEMVGEKITLGVNGQTLNTVMDSTLKSGYFDLYVSTSSDDSIKEIRFRNFRIYSLE